MEWLEALGLNKKQRTVYLQLLEAGAATAAEIAQVLGEQRTNVYLIVDHLISVGLVERDETHAVARFRVTNPENLQKRMTEQQRALATRAAQMKQALPELLGLYHLNSAPDGMAYFEGLRGYEAVLDDMNKTQGEICAFGATWLQEERPDAWGVLMGSLQKRAALKVRTRIIFEESIRESLELSVDRSPLLQRYMEARFWGKSTFHGELVIYDATVVLTSYDEKLVSLVIKNRSIATTMQTIFDTAWQASGQRVPSST